MMRRLTVAVLVPGMLVLAATPAQADDQSYLSYLNSHGFKYQNRAGLTTPDGAISFGGIICQNIRRGRPPKDRFDPKIADGINQVMIDAAQHELCPDTLVKSPQPTPETPPTPGVPPPGAEPPPPPPPELPPPAPELPPPPPAPELPPPPPPPAPELPPPPPPPAPELPPPPPAPELPPPPPAPEPPPPGAAPQQ